jgi:FtsP/CotA-like multicopper oxidase with cupredoxin domain
MIGMDLTVSRRKFLVGAGAFAGIGVPCTTGTWVGSALADEDETADYTLHIKSSPIEIAPKRIISAITYNGQFPGPLLRFKEGRQVTVAIYNNTDAPEQLHWHGKKFLSM